MSAWRLEDVVAGMWEERVLNHFFGAVERFELDPGQREPPRREEATLREIQDRLVDSFLRFPIIGVKRR